MVHFKVFMVFRYFRKINLKRKHAEKKEEEEETELSLTGGIIATTTTTTKCQRH